jgi:release factor glutamine methyltransferase
VPELLEVPRSDAGCANVGAAWQEAIVALATWLRDGGYAFVPPTPETHRRNAARAPSGSARTLRDVFGWSRPFERSLLPASLFVELERVGIVAAAPEGRWRSRVRFASLGNDLFAHSAYPTIEADSVFFGPDTYRFARFVARVVGEWRQPARGDRNIVDIGCGSGAGGIAAWRLLGGRDRLVLADINARALAFAQANARFARVSPVDIVRSDVFAAIAGDADLVIANPPYMSDAQARAYRHGGGLHGCELSVRIVRESLARLRPGGCLALYTGTAIVAGRDVFRTAVTPLLRDAGLRYSYEEIDPDVFGEELDSPSYADVERIAVVGLAIHDAARSEPGP